METNEIGGSGVAMAIRKDTAVWAVVVDSISISLAVGSGDAVGAGDMVGIWVTVGVGVGGNMPVGAGVEVGAGDLARH